MKANSFQSHTSSTIVAILKIQTKFCIVKCLVNNDINRVIFNVNKCNTLVSSDILDTKDLFTKIYNHHCTSQSTLDWSIDLHASDILTSKGLQVLLPGIYEKAELYICYHNYSKEINKDKIKITWNDKRIIQTANTSLLLNGKKYYVFSEIVNQRKVYSWKEAKEFCTKFESNLPIFASQSDIQDFVDIILRAAWTGPIRMIFIGLQVSMTNVFDYLSIHFINK